MAFKRGMRVEKYRGREKTFFMDRHQDEGPDMEIQMVDCGDSE